MFTSQLLSEPACAQFTSRAILSQREFCKLNVLVLEFKCFPHSLAQSCLCAYIVLCYAQIYVYFFSGRRVCEIHITIIECYLFIQETFLSGYLDRYWEHKSSTHAQLTTPGRRQFIWEQIITKQFQEWAESWKHRVGTD